MPVVRFHLGDGWIFSRNWLRAVHDRGRIIRIRTVGIFVLRCDAFSLFQGIQVISASLVTSSKDPPPNRR